MLWFLKLNFHFLGGRLRSSTNFLAAQHRARLPTLIWGNERNRALSTRFDFHHFLGPPREETAVRVSGQSYLWRKFKIFFMRRYETLRMGNVIKYRTHVVLWIASSSLWYWTSTERGTKSCITDGLECRLFHFSCQKAYSSGRLNFKNMSAICPLL